MTPLLILAGPTGVGKTAVAIELCRLLNGEIISADSMQIYTGCDIATAKPSPEEQARARHHLLDVCEPTQIYSAAQWANDAQLAIADITQRGKLPIIAGGTGFYINALLRPNLLAPVAPDEALRAQLEAELQKHGAHWMHARLHKLDAQAAQRLHPNDAYRVLRALEIGLRRDALEGQSLTSAPQMQYDNANFPMAETPFNWRAFVLEMPRELLNRRLNARIDLMLEDGMEDELRGLLEQGVPRDAPALRGVGYKQMLPSLEDPNVRAACVEQWKTATRRYAKRQRTWFRHQLPAQIIEVPPDDDAAQIAAHIAQQWNS